jgi:hypothetical protein
MPEHVRVRLEPKLGLGSGLLDHPLRAFEANIREPDHGVHRGAISLIIENSSLQQIRKFPVPLSRESFCKPLNSLANGAPVSGQEARNR